MARINVGILPGVKPLGLLDRRLEQRALASQEAQKRADLEYRRQAASEEQRYRRSRDEIADERYASELQYRKRRDQKADQEKADAATAKKRGQFAAGLLPLVDSWDAAKGTPEQADIGNTIVQFVGSNLGVDVSGETFDANDAMKFRAEFLDDAIAAGYEMPERKKDEGTYGRPKEGINPDTGKLQAYVTNKEGDIKWLDVGVEEKKGTSKTRERKIADAVNILGLPEDQAIKMVDGYLDTQLTEAGDVLLVDETNGNVKELPREQSEIYLSKASNGAPSYSLYEMAQKGTGPKSGTQALLSYAFAFMNQPHDRTVIDARQRLTTDVQDMVRALAVNPRFPVAEQNRILEEVGIKPSFWKAPSIMQTQMESIEQSLLHRAATMEADSYNTSLPQDVRAMQRANASRIRNFVKLMGVPKRPEGLPEGSFFHGYHPDTKAPMWQDPDGSLWVDDGS